MYEFSKEKDFKAFDDFLIKNNGTYMQCSLWPEAKPDWKPHFYVGYNGSERVFQCLILGRDLPIAGLIWYIPDGFICDYSNKQLITEFVSFIKNEMKKNNVTALLTDPHIPLRVNHNYNQQGLDTHKLLIDCGFKINHNIENYIYKAPVQYYLSLKDKETGESITTEKLIHNCEKGVRYSVRIGAQRGLTYKICSYDDIKKDPSLMNDFMKVMGDTSGRNDFLERSNEYTTRLMGVFKDYSDITLVYYDKLVDKKLQDERDRQVEANLKKMETCNEKQKKKLTNENEAIEQQTENYLKRKKLADEFSQEDKFVVAGGFTIRFNGIAGCVFGGSRNILRNETRPSHYVNYLRLKKSVETGMDIHDFGYVFVNEIEPPKNPDDNLTEFEVREDFKGIRDFKESFNTDLIEFIGEYALVNDNLKFKLYSDIVPKARKTKMKITRKFAKR
ncbi:MAG: peptidoglycan bridge formation glycyltransferase FemA/FemB family protein [Ruminococcus sp.]|nr:peptidoglycan bridge formation glycyltransferase FemA/FemB family protein [Candidatus Copronaster equi]